MDKSYLVPLLIGGSILFLLFVFFILAYVILYTRRVQRSRMERAQLEFDYERKMLDARLQEQEGAMAQISKEIHDNVSQKVDFITMNIKALADAGVSPGSEKYLRNSQGLLDQVANDLRNISYSLNGDYIKSRGLVEVLEKELAYVETASSIKCVLTIDGYYRPLGGERELLIYRIAQEAIHNAVKYAQCATLTIHLEYTDSRFQMEIADDGVGFDATDPELRNGLGLKNMKQRATILGGTLDVGSIRHGGCKVILRLGPDAEGI